MPRVDGDDALAAAGGPPADPFAAVHAGARERVLDQPGHPAWDVLDRARVERLLARDPAALDVMSRYQVWRLVTVFGGDLLDPGP